MNRQQRIESLREKYAHIQDREETVQQRRESVVRILRVVEVVAMYRFGIVTRDVAKELADDYPVHTRTVLRDLQALESLGIVEKKHHRWFWCHDILRAAIHHRSAQRAAQSRETTGTIAAGNQQLSEVAFENETTANRMTG